MDMNKRKNRFLVTLLSLCMVITALPMSAVTAQAEGNVAYIGDTGYTSLGAAVSAASSGDMITLEADDATAQKITISKDLIIELDGHNLTKTSFNITGGNVVIRDRQGVATISCGYNQAIRVDSNTPDRRIHTTILTTGGKLTLDGVSVNGYNDVKNNNLPKAVFIGGGDVTINSGRFTGGDANNSGGDAVYFHTGTLTINGGTFIGGTGGGCGLSSTNGPGDKLSIRHGTFIGGYRSSAFWLGGNINSQSSLEEYFLSEDNYIVGDFDSENVTIGTDFFLSPVFTEPENGSANANEPATIYLATGDSTTLEPHVLGGEGGTLTYEWYKDDTKIDGASGSSYTVSGEGDFVGDYRAVISEAGTGHSHTITVYWRVIKLAHSHNICGEGECTHSGHTSVEYTALDNGAGGLAEGVIATSDSVYGSTLKEGNYYLTADLALSEPLVITSAVNICLNGNSLTFTDEDFGFHLGGSNANHEAQLTVCDCSAEETGEIVTRADNAKTIYNRSGDIFVYGGMISGEDNAIYTADHKDAGNVYIYGGKITTTGYNSAINILAKDNGNRKLIISVGEIEGIDSYMPMEISGGTITDDVYAYSDVTMTGGTINGQLTINSSEKKNVKISGNARIEATSGNAIYSKENIDLEISGGTIAAQNGYAIRLTNSQSKIYLSGNPVISGKSADIEIMPTSNPDAAVLVLSAKEGTDNPYTGEGLSISSCGTENKDLYLAQKVDSADLAAKFSLASPADCYLAYDDTNKAIQIKERTYTITLPSGQEGYTVTAESGSTSPVDKNGSYSFTMTISDGYYTTDDFIVKANETELKPDDNGVYTISNITADQTVTVEGVALDEKAPSVKIQLENNEWKEFLNNITFGLFFKESKTVTILATDYESGVAETEYFVSDTIYESAEALETAVGKNWNEYNDSISISPKGKKIVYAKVTDNVGNVSYASSHGIVLYTDAAQKTASISYTKTSKTDVTAEVTLNDNTIDEIYCGDTKLTYGTDYTVSGGTITFDADWLDTLAAGNYTLTVHYNPFGMDYVDNAGNAAPSTTTIALSVVKATGSVEITNDISRTYDGSEVADVTYTKSSTGNATVEYKERDAADSTYTTTKPSVVGDYTVRVTVAEDDNYADAAATKDFEIKYLSTPENPYIISGTQGTDGWYTDDVKIMPPDGYTISSTLNGEYTESITISESTENISIHLKNDQGQMTDAIAVDNIQIDKEPPGGEITISPEPHSEGLFNSGITVTITGSDNEDGSDVKSIEYYYSENEISEDDDSIEWIAYEGETDIPAEDDTTYYIYAKVTDYAGNQTITEPSVVTFDTTAPVIDGVEVTAEYYTTQTFTVSDDVETVTINGETVEMNPEKPYILSADPDAMTDTVYEITVTDKAGNTATKKVTIKSISSLKETIKDLNKDNVDNENREAIEEVIAKVNEVLDAAEGGAAVQAELAALQEIIDESEDLITKIEVDDFVEEAISLDIPNVNKYDRAEVEKLKGELESYLNDPEMSENLSDDQKAQLEDMLSQLEQALSRIYAQIAADNAPPQSDRVAGENRYETAMTVADKLKEELGVGSFKTIVVAYGDEFADAVSATELAAANDAPVLLVNENNEDAVRRYISENLAPGGKVYIAGESEVVSDEFENGLDQWNAVRLGGENRYETNLELLKSLDFTKQKNLIIASGADFADALSASSAGIPVMLVGKSLTDDQIEFLKDLPGSVDVHIAGGTKAVGEYVETQLAENGFDDVDRFGGANRYETSKMLAEAFYKGTNAVYVASGDDFPDGLTGGVLASIDNAPLILINEQNTAHAADFVKDKNVKNVIAVGGTSVITEAMLDAVAGR